jgi:hypothetical protein
VTQATRAPQAGNLTSTSASQQAVIPVPWSSGLVLKHPLDLPLVVPGRALVAAANPAATTARHSSIFPIIDVPGDSRLNEAFYTVKRSAPSASNQEQVKVVDV